MPHDLAPNSKTVKPYSDDFEEALSSYCEQIADAVHKNKHHDHRRSLFINFLRQGMGLDPVEYEIERKIKANSVRGRIDAFFGQVIIEVKTNFEREREDALRELKKYFDSQPHPDQLVALVTDGKKFEVYIHERGKPFLIRAFELDADDPLSAFRHLDQILFTATLIIPTPGDIVDRFGLHSATYNATRRSLIEAYEKVQSDSAVQLKFQEWNALLSKVYGTEVGDSTLFITHTYLEAVS